MFQALYYYGTIAYAYGTVHDYCDIISSSKTMSKSSCRLKIGIPCVRRRACESVTTSLEATQTLVVEFMLKYHENCAQQLFNALCFRCEMQKRSTEYKRSSVYSGFLRPVTGVWKGCSFFIFAFYFNGFLLQDRLFSRIMSTV